MGPHNKELNAFIEGLKELSDIEEIDVSVTKEDDIKQNGSININLFFRDNDEGFDCFSGDPEELEQETKLYDKITDCFYW